MMIGRSLRNKKKKKKERIKEKETKMYQKDIILIEVIVKISLKFFTLDENGSLKIFFF